MDNRMEKRENNLKPCVHRPFRIRAYMDSLDMDQLLLSNLFKFSINIVKIIMKIKDRITYNPIFDPPTPIIFFSLKK